MSLYQYSQLVLLLHSHDRHRLLVISVVAEQAFKILSLSATLQGICSVLYSKMLLPLDVSSRAVLLLSQVAIYSYTVCLSLITSLRALFLFLFFQLLLLSVFWLIATLRSFFIRAIKVQIYFCRMVENHFVMVRIVFKLSSVANCEASSCLGFWIQIILATLRIVL